MGADEKPLGKMNVHAGITRPNTSIAIDARWAGNSHRISIIEVARDDVVLHSSVDAHNRSRTEAPMKTIGGNHGNAGPAGLSDTAAFSRRCPSGGTNECSLPLP